VSPLPGRPQTISWEAFLAEADDWRADPGLAKDLAELLPETTDDVPVP
jgi:hypothetical protein